MIQAQCYRIIRLGSLLDTSQFEPSHMQFKLQPNFFIASRVIFLLSSRDLRMYLRSVFFTYGGRGRHCVRL